jgi:hypothetical protein
MNQIEYMHYRPMVKNANGGATVAILPTENNTAIVSVARCGPLDLFNKKIGRAVAAGRIQAYLAGRRNMENYVFTVDVPNMLELKSTVAKELVDEMGEIGLQ